MNEETIKLFLEELTLLTKKYKIAIGGCGCCGSPYLYKEYEDKNYLCDDDGDYLNYDKPL